MTSDPVPAPDHAFVWVWPPEATEPVVAGRLDDRGGLITFVYARSYLELPEAMALYLPELPLRRGEIPPRSGEIAGCVADAAPDAWGRRVIEHRRGAGATDLSILAHLLESGSDRIGALDFQSSPTHYEARRSDSAALADLAEATERVETGETLTPALDRALLHGTSVGGARAMPTGNDYGGASSSTLTPSRDTGPDPSQQPDNVDRISRVFAPEPLDCTVIAAVAVRAADRRAGIHRHQHRRQQPDDHRKRRQRRERRTPAGRPPGPR